MNLDLLKDVVASPEVAIGTAIVLIAAAFMLWLFIAAIPLRRLHEQLNNAISLLEKQAKTSRENSSPEQTYCLPQTSYEEMNTDFSNNFAIKKSWHNYRRTLVPTEKKEPGYLAAYSSENFFGDSIYQSANVNMKLLSAIPAYLISTGLLLTFFWLVIALVFTGTGLEAGSNVQETQEALKDLINVASYKFLTSIAGLLSSIVFSWRLKQQQYNIRRKMSELCLLLDECIPVVSPVDFLAYAVNRGMDVINQGMDASLRKHFSPLSESIGRLSVTVSEANEKAAEKVSESNEKAAEKVSESNEKAAEMICAGNREMVGNISKEMGRFVGELKVTNEQAIQYMVEEFVKQLQKTTAREVESAVESLREVKEGFSQISKEARETMTHEIDASAKGLREARATLSDLSKDFRETNQEIRKSTTHEIEAATAGLREVKHEVKMMVADLNREVYKAANDISHSIKDGWTHGSVEFKLAVAPAIEALQRLEMAVGSMEKELPSAVKTAVGSLEKELPAAVRKANDILFDTMTALEQHIKKLDSRSAAYQSALEQHIKNLDSTSAASQSVLEQHIKKLDSRSEISQSALEQHTKNLDSTSAASQAALEEHIKNIDSRSEASQSALEQHIENMNGASAAYQKIAEELNHALEQFAQVRSVVNTVGQSIEHVEHIENSLREIHQEAIASFEAKVEQFGGHIESYEGTLQTLSGNIADTYKGTQHEVQSLKKMVTELDGYTERSVQALSGFAKKVERLEKIVKRMPD